MVTVTDRITNALFPVVLIAGLILGVFLWVSKDGSELVTKLLIAPVPVMHIGEVPITVEFAVTEEERSQGLSGRDAIGESKGLLFVFPEPDFYSMWMKDMKFPIDIIWISKDLKVVGINENVAPESYPKTFRSPKPALYALEVEASFVKTFSIAVGQIVRIPEGLY